MQKNNEMRNVQGMIEKISKIINFKNYNDI